MVTEDSGNNSESTPFSSTPSEHIDLTRHIPSAEGRLDRFFQRINQFFMNESPVNTVLQGRIQELQSHANTALTQLVTAKEVLETKSGDPYFNGLINSVFDPFIKEINRIQRAMEREASSPLQVKISNRYAEWIEKAKWWIEMCDRFETAEDASAVLLEHAILEFHACIDRDVRVIQDYLNQGIQSRELSEAAHSEVERRLNSELSLHLSALHQLKSVPAEDSVVAFYAWRTQVDSLRAKCFSDALHSIDAITNDVQPVEKKQAETDPHPELLITISALESKLELLAAELSRRMDDAHKKQCAFQLSLLEGEAHRLNGDLRLSPEHSDRVQSALDMLGRFRQQLNL